MPAGVAPAALVPGTRAASPRAEAPAEAPGGKAAEQQRQDMDDRSQQEQQTMLMFCPKDGCKLILAIYREEVSHFVAMGSLCGRSECARASGRAYGAISQDVQGLRKTAQKISGT